MTAGGHYYAQHGRDLGALVERLELHGIVLGGWSWGTLESLAYVNQFGADRLAGLIVLDGPPRAALPDNVEDWVSYRYDDADGARCLLHHGPADRLRRSTGCTTCSFSPIPGREHESARFSRWGGSNDPPATRHVLKRRQYPSMIGAIR